MGFPGYVHINIIIQAKQPQIYLRLFPRVIRDRYSLFFLHSSLYYICRQIIQPIFSHVILHTMPSSLFRLSSVPPHLQHSLHIHHSFSYIIPLLYSLHGHTRRDDFPSIRKILSIIKLRHHHKLVSN